MLRPHVHAQIVAELSHRTREITVRLLAERAAPYFPYFATPAQRRLIRTVDQVVRQIAETDRDTFAYLPATATRSDAMVRMLRTPEDRDVRGRTQAYQALRPRRARRPAPAIIGQLDLLDDLVTSESDETDGSPDHNDNPEEDSQ